MTNEDKILTMLSELTTDVKEIKGDIKKLDTRMDRLESSQRVTIKDWVIK